MYMNDHTHSTLKFLLPPEDFESLEVFNTLSHKSLLKILKKAQIRTCGVDNNMYGEFMFIHFTIEGIDLFVYGLGLHENRKKIYKEEWKVANDNPFDKDKNLGYAGVVRQINERKKEIEEWREPEQDVQSLIFSELADMSDEDGALGMMEDFGL